MLREINASNIVFVDTRKKCNGKYVIDIGYNAIFNNNVELIVVREFFRTIKEAYLAEKAYKVLLNKVDRFTLIT